MWRKPQNKKHKTWEGDGVLILEGNKLKLFDKDTAKQCVQFLLALELSRTSKYRLGTSSWRGGDPLGAGSELQVAGKEIEIDAPTTAEEYTSGRLFMSTEAASAVVPTASKSFTAPAPSFKDPKLPKATALGTKASVPSTTKALATGLSKKPQASSSKQPTPKFDPLAPGAIVMPRPDARQEAKLNPKGFPIVDVVVDPYIAQHLRPHQVEGVKFMYESVMGMRSEGQGAILADEM
jgi:DNA repair and recombination protein RAD54B